MRLVLALLGFLGAILVLAACAAAPPAPPPATSTATTTSARPPTTTPLTLAAPAGGEPITLPAPPQRIASLSAAHTEILFAIGAGGQVAAVDLFSDYPEEAKARTKLDAFQPSVEAILTARPDLVLLTYDPGGVAESLKRVQVPVLFLPLPQSLNGLLEQVHFLGRATGHEQEAEALAASMRRRIQAVEERVRDLSSGPRVYLEVDANLFSAGPQSFTGEFLAILKVQNIATAGDYPQLTQEVILARNPEVVILADAAAYGDGSESRETVAARPGWGAIAAVRQGRVYAIEADLVSRPGPRVVEGLEALGRLLYPDRFP